MTSKDLNIKLIRSIPEICNAYFKEVSWQEGDETGSHVVYADVFVPFIKEKLIENDVEKVLKSFDYIEEILEMNDQYANEVITLSVIETLNFDEELKNIPFEEFTGKMTRKLIEELKNYN